jgi:hypothetical protein
LAAKISTLSRLNELRAIRPGRAFGPVWKSLMQAGDGVAIGQLMIRKFRFLKLNIYQQLWQPGELLRQV